MTRKDVARVAGTSTAIVSYVINNGPRPVAERTRQRVLAAIEEVGYVPDTVAQALASGVSGLYGLIVPDISNPFFAALAHELEDSTSESGHILLLGDSAEDKDREKELISTFVRRRVDGLLFVGVDSHPDLSAAFDGEVPVVILDRVDPEHLASSVAVDNVAAAHAVTAHLVTHGYREHAIITGPEQLLTARERLQGWRSALAEAELLADPRWIVEAPFTRRGGYDAGSALITSGPRPRAVFASNELQAVGLLAAAAEHGLRVPDELAVITFDGTEMSEYTAPKLSGVVQPLDEIARAAVAMLPGKHRSTSFAPRHERCGYTIRLRPSCGHHPD
ncbi:LacI family DNA-binding transcriptional regulator [Brachybacterium vulturis]|uniref:LacI family DNA-binding transcriptional regulator n=1 Tax=Brachybacterium vulturis TaxID=2017484 RepID=UPI001C44EAA0|nr:LacI family DNA-binding transcriptional regulator [Brachybacterium vulturis]